jgi:hypothetical protein
MIGIDPVPLFPLGSIVITPGAVATLDQASVKLAIAKHAAGDWGILGADDRRRNDETVLNGGTLASIYQDSRGKKFYVLTESDRTRTSVLLPEEY